MTADEAPRGVAATDDTERAADPVDLRRRADPTRRADPPQRADNPQRTPPAPPWTPGAARPPQPLTRPSPPPHSAARPQEPLTRPSPPRPASPPPVSGSPATVLPDSRLRRPAPPRSTPPRTGERAVPARSAGVAGRARKVRLALKRVDPWSVFLFSLLASVFAGLAVVVAVAALYVLLASLGAVASINELVGEVTGESSPLITPSRFLGGAAVLAAVNVVLLTLLATLSSLLYNVCASFTGGIELTLGERDSS